MPSSSGPKPAPQAMAALVATPVHATIALQPRPWGTEIDLTCWYQRGAAEPPSDRYELVAHGADGATYDLGSWQLTPGRKSSSPAAPHSPGHRSRTSRSPSPTGPPSSRWGWPASSGPQIASQASGPQPGPGKSRTCARDGTRRGPVSHGRWLVSLTRWTAANPRPCHWISLMQAEPRYSR